MSKDVLTEEVLAGVPLFSALSKADLARVVGLMTILEVPAGTELTKQGANGREFILVLDGEIEVRRDDQVLAVSGAGSYVGEIALLQNTPRTATVTALAPSKVGVISAGEFAGLLQQFPDVALPIVVSMADRMAELEGHREARAGG